MIFPSVAGPFLRKAADSDLFGFECHFNLSFEKTESLFKLGEARLFPGLRHSFLIRLNAVVDTDARNERRDDQRSQTELKFLHANCPGESPNRRSKSGYENVRSSVFAWN